METRQHSDDRGIRELLPSHLALTMCGVCSGTKLMTPDKQRAIWAIYGAPRPQPSAIPSVGCDAHAGPHDSSLTGERALGPGLSQHWGAQLHARVRVTAQPTADETVFLMQRRAPSPQRRPSLNAGFF